MFIPHRAQDLDILLEADPDDNRRSVPIKAPAAGGQSAFHQESALGDDERAELVKQAERLRAELEDVEKQLGLSTGGLRHCLFLAAFGCKSFGCVFESPLWPLCARRVALLT